MKFVIAEVYDNYIEANLAMSLLQSENINCWLKDENIIGIEPGITYAIGGIKMMVVEVQLKRACEILKRNTSQSTDRPRVCAECGSANIVDTGRQCKATGFISAIANALLPTNNIKIYCCFDCGQEYVPG